MPLPAGRIRATKVVAVCEIGGRDLPFDCRLAGTRSSWELLDCAEPCIGFDHPELTCPAMEVCVTGDRFQGTVGATVISGNRVVTWEAADAATGAPVGTVEITGSLQLTP